MKIINLYSIAIITLLFFNLSCSSQDYKRSKSELEYSLTKSNEGLEDNPFKVTLTGYLDEISKNENLILYRVPYDWESDEYKLAKLLLYDVEAKESIEIADTIILNYPPASFLNDNVIVIPTQSKVYFYDIGRSEVVDVSVKLEEDKFLLQFSLNEDRSKAGLLYLDFTERKVILKILDFVRDTELEVVHSYNTDNPSYKTGRMFWSGDQVIYSFQNSIYYYKLGSPEFIIVSDRSNYLYAIDQNSLLFFENIKNELLIKKYSFTKLVVDNVNDQSISWPDNLEFCYLHSVRYDGILKILLEVNKDIYSYQKPGFRKEKSLLLFDSERVSIQNNSFPAKRKYLIDKNEIIINVKNR